MRFNLYDVYVISQYDSKCYAVTTTLNGYEMLLLDNNVDLSSLEERIESGYKIYQFIGV